MTVAQLVPKPKASLAVRESVVGILRKALAEAEAGDVTTVIVIIAHPDGEWSDLASDTEQFSEAVGRLEITKHEWIVKYLSQRGEA